MNYIGHAAVASWHSSAPLFVLGAMLPDFASFLGFALPTPTDGELHAGIVLHHATDLVFHETTVFRTLSRKARFELEHAGVPRGPARAVAHVGVEMLIDAQMAKSGTVRDSLSTALSAVLSPRLEGALPLHAQDRERLKHVVLFIHSRGASAWSSEPTLVAGRLARTFASRPRLALSPESIPPIEGWVASASREVLEHSSALENELRHGLAARGY